MDTRTKKLTDATYSPTIAASEEAIRAQVDGAIQEVYDIVNTAKTDKYGDHAGTWQGLKPTQAEPGLSAKVETHLADTVSVNIRDFGVNLDGTQDSTAAMQAVANYFVTKYRYGTVNNVYAAGAKEHIWFPPKSTIIIKDTVDLSFINELTIYGNGSIVKFDGDVPKTMFDLVGCSSLDMYDLDINGMGKSGAVIKQHGTVETDPINKQRVTRNHYVRCNITNPAAGYDVVQTNDGVNLFVNIDESSFISSLISRGSNAGRLFSEFAEMSFVDCTFIHRGVGATHAFESGNMNFFGCYFPASEVDYWFGLNNEAGQYQIAMTACNVESATKGIIGQINASATRFRGKAVFNGTQVVQAKTENSLGIVNIPTAEFCVEIKAPILNEATASLDGRIFAPNGFVYLESIQNGNSAQAYYITGAKEQINIGYTPVVGYTFNIKSTTIPTLYVDAVNGSDENFGAASNPLKTFTEALKRTSVLKKAKIMLYAGTDASPNVYELTEDYTMNYQNIEVISTETVSGQTNPIYQRCIVQSTAQKRLIVSTGSDFVASGIIVKTNATSSAQAIILVNGGNARIPRIQFTGDNQFAIRLTMGNVYLYYTSFIGAYANCRGIDHTATTTEQTGVCGITEYSVSVDAGLTGFLKYQTNASKLLLTNIV